jgi:hypothetical protein
MKDFSLSLSVPPNTQCPSCRQPQLYLLRENLHHSISTSISGPPVTTGSIVKYSAHTLHISCTDWQLSCAISTKVKGALYVHMYMFVHYYCNLRLVPSSIILLMSSVVSSICNCTRLLCITVEKGAGEPNHDFPELNRIILVLPDPCLSVFPVSSYRFRNLHTCDLLAAIPSPSRAPTISLGLNPRL